MESWLNCIGAPVKDWANIVITYLDPPAFSVIKATKTNLENKGQWNNTFEQIKEVLLRNFGDIDPNFTVRSKLANLRLLYPKNILGYTKAFHELCTKITDEPLSDQAKISAYLNGILHGPTYAELIIEPSTGTRWNDFTRLYDYVMAKYSVLQLSQSEIRMKDNVSSGNNEFVNQPHAQRSRRDTRYNNRPRRYGFGTIRRRLEAFKMARGGQDYRNPPKRIPPYLGPDHRRPWGNNKGSVPRPPQRPPNSDSRRPRNPNNRPNNGRFAQMTIDDLVPGQKLTPEMKEMLIKKKACFKCFKVGHMTKHCPMHKK